MKIDLQPILEDNLLVVRPLARNDFQNLSKVASDPFVWEQHQSKSRYTIEEFTPFFDEAIASRGALVILDKNSKQIIGSSRYKRISEAEGVLEIGWSFLARAYWGGRYNRSLKKLMVNYALQYCNHVVFYVNQKNHRSQKAMEKLGGRKVNDKNKSWILPSNKGVTYVVTEPFS